MALESSAAFKARAKEIGISEADLNLLQAGGIDSFSRYAFCCAFQPGGTNEDVLFDHVEAILGSRPTNADASNYRRLFFESHALADLKQCDFFCISHKSKHGMRFIMLQRDRLTCISSSTLCLRVEEYPLFACSSLSSCQEESSGAVPVLFFRIGILS